MSKPRKKSRDPNAGGATDHRVAGTTRTGAGWEVWVAETAGRYRVAWKYDEAKFTPPKGTFAVVSSIHAAGMLHVDLLSPAEAKKSADHFASALADHLHLHDLVQADALVRATTNWISTRATQKARWRYIVAASVPGFVSLGAFICMMVMCGSSSSIETSAKIATSCFAGGVGALLSVIARGGNIDVDPTAVTSFHSWAGASRIMLGVLSGLVAALAMDTQIVFACFRGESFPPFAASSLVGVAAGFVERFAPELLARFAQDQEKSLIEAERESQDAQD